MQLTARQCVAEAASKRVRLAALDAYDLIGSELNGRYEVQVSQVAQDEIEKKQQQHDQEMQDTLAATKKTGASIGAFLDAVNQQDRRLTSQYNRLVDNYNDLSDRYRNVYNLALEAVNLAESLNNQRSSSLPIFVEAPKPTPLHCTADTTYHFGILTTSTTYMDCR